jgi:cobalt-precorrin 5A hydrolase
MVMGETMIVAGIGCRKGVSAAEVIAAVETGLNAHGLSVSALSALATTTFKREEEAIFAAGRDLELPVIVVEDAALSSSPAVGSDRFTPLHPASAPLGHPLPVGERNASAAGANPAATADAAAFQNPTSQRNEQEAGIADRSLFPNGEKVAAKRPDEGASQTLTHSELSQALAGVPSVSEAAALAAAGEGARLLGPRIVVGPVTCALAASGDLA